MRDTKHASVVADGNDVGFDDDIDLIVRSLYNYDFVLQKLKYICVRRAHNPNKPTVKIRSTYFVVVIIRIEIFSENPKRA
jgi:hypothetical protein